MAVARAFAAALAALAALLAALTALAALLAALAALLAALAALLAALAAALAAALRARRSKVGGGRRVHVQGYLLEVAGGMVQHCRAARGEAVGAPPVEECTVGGGQRRGQPQQGEVGVGAPRGEVRPVELLDAARTPLHGGGRRPVVVAAGRLSVEARRV
jgi:hypothetical protein